MHDQHIIEEFRANHGMVGGPFAERRLILLTTTGARTGAPRTVPVGFVPDEDGRMLVLASAGGAPRRPAWFHNLRAHPRVTVETGAFTFQADAVVLAGEERDRLFARAAAAEPGWAEYQATAGRPLPVVALHPVDGAPNEVGGWGDQLKLIHDAFRRELAVVRREVAASGGSLGAQLRINCLTLCQGLHYHHEREDEDMFPGLAAVPELAPVLARLRQQHTEIARLLDALQAAVATDAAADPAAVRSRVEQLTGELEAHLAEEEQHLVPMLNQMSTS